MQRKKLLLSVVAVAAVTVLSGVLQGRMRNRWGPSADMLAVAAKLKNLPAEFGDWRLRSSEKLGKASIIQLEPFGYFVHTYENRAAGAHVNITLLIGPPGPTSVHTPEICFGSRDYQSQGERQPVAIRRADGSNDELWTLDYKANNIRGDLLRVYYGWSTGDRWLAAQDPRFSLAGQPYLYKIQILHDLPPAGYGPSSDPCRKFLDDFLPVLRRCMVEPSI